MTFPIYVLSKGRLGTASTCSALDAAKLPYTLITMPEEAVDYRRSYQGTVLPLQTEGMHVGQVRNAILDEARHQQQAKIWMLDDDLLSVGRSGYDWETLGEVEQMMDDYAATVAGLCDREAMRTREHHAVKMNVECYHMVALDIQKIGTLRYNEDLFFFSDTDFLLQILLHGETTVRSLAHGYTCAPVGKTKGGLYHAYQQQNRVADALLMVARYGIDIVSLLAPPARRPGWVRLNVAWDHAVEKGKKHAASARL